MYLNIFVMEAKRARIDSYEKNVIVTRRRGVIPEPELPEELRDIDVHTFPEFKQKTYCIPVKKIDNFMEEIVKKFKDDEEDTSQEKDKEKSNKKETKEEDFFKKQEEEKSNKNKHSETRKEEKEKIDNFTKNIVKKYREEKQEIDLSLYRNSKVKMFFEQGQKYLNRQKNIIKSVRLYEDVHTFYSLITSDYVIYYDFVDLFRVGSKYDQQDLLNTFHHYLVFLGNAKEKIYSYCNAFEDSTDEVKKNVFKKLFFVETLNNSIPLSLCDEFYGRTKKLLDVYNTFFMTYLKNMYEEPEDLQKEYTAEQNNLIIAKEEDLIHKEKKIKDLGLDISLFNQEYLVCNEVFI
jgi:hypothetical protein